MSRILERIAELRAEWAETTGESSDDYSLSEDDWSVGLGEHGAAEIVVLLEQEPRERELERIRDRDRRFVVPANGSAVSPDPCRMIDAAQDAVRDRRELLIQIAELEERLAAADES